jgi:uncharacterized protein YbaP (TraB family)
MRHAVLAAAVALAAACAGTAAPRPIPTDRLADLDDSAMSDEVVKAASLRACPRIARPRLWRVEKDGKTSHLFGTYHVGVGADRLPDVVIEAFTASATVAFETVRDAESGAAELDPAPPAELTEDEWARLVAVVGADAGPVLRELSAPEIIAVLAIMFIDRDARLDDELESAARELDKPVVALETHAELAVPVERWLGQRTLAIVARGLDGRRAMRDRAMRGLADYCAGRDRDGFDAGDLEAGFSRAELRAMEEDLVLARNRAWLPRIEELFAAGGAFVAVGAAHLRGDGSVVELLRQRGYQVTRVEAR